MYGNVTMLDPYQSVSTKAWTNVHPSELGEIDVNTAESMQKVHMEKFDSKKRHWNRWHHDFETAMKGAKINQNRWVSMLPTYLDDPSWDEYEEITGPGHENQYIQWAESASLFEARFQEKTNLNNVLLLLHTLKFDRNKDEFTDFSTKFLSLVHKAYSSFDPANLDKVASSELRDKIPLGWLIKLVDAHDEDVSRITFTYDHDFCEHLQAVERARSKHQCLNDALKNGDKDEKKGEQEKNQKAQVATVNETILLDSVHV